MNAGNLQKLLVIDDDQKLCRLLRDYLAPLGYDVTAVHTGPEGLVAAREGVFDAVVLDLMLPGMDGCEVLRQLRKESDVPVLMLTARGEEADRIVGLEMGADDNLPKTFSTRELLARLRAVTRRSRLTAAKSDPSGRNEDAPVVVGNLRIEPATRIATLNDKPISLTAVEFDLLLALA